MNPDANEILIEHGRDGLRLAIDNAKSADRPSQGEHCLALADWLRRDIPSPDRLLGDLLSTTTRMMLVAPTGLGKTNFAMAMACHMAAGANFLHWKTVRPARVLFIDGEMSRRLVKIRLVDAVRRLGNAPRSLFVVSRDDVEDMPPLNTEAGQAFIDGIIAKIGGIDFVFFDNVQALLTGDMKDEESWHQTLPWVKALTKRSIGQIWVHHTGHNTTRSYGTSTREWQLDSVALMEPIERSGTDIAFNLSFSKARERTPENRADFEAAIITLEKDVWSVETAPNKKRGGKPPSPLGMKFHGALISALAANGRIEQRIGNLPSVTRDEWRTECIRRGLIDPKAKPDSARTLMNKHQAELIATNYIACDGDLVWDRMVSA